MRTVITDLERLPERIKASAERIEDIKVMLKNEQDTRDELICRAVDEAGIAQKTVAEYASLSQPHILRILAAQE